VVVHNFKIWNGKLNNLSIRQIKNDKIFGGGRAFFNADKAPEGGGSSFLFANALTPPSGSTFCRTGEPFACGGAVFFVANPLPPYGSGGFCCANVCYRSFIQQAVHSPTCISFIIVPVKKVKPAIQ
jgi:hypothetical protein